MGGGLAGRSRESCGRAGGDAVVGGRVKVAIKEVGGAVGGDAVVEMAPLSVVAVTISSL